MLQNSCYFGKPVLFCSLLQPNANSQADHRQRQSTRCPDELTEVEARENRHPKYDVRLKCMVDTVDPYHLISMLHQGTKAEVRACLPSLGFFGSLEPSRGHMLKWKDREMA